jgi:hypothetical protein
MGARQAFGQKEETIMEWVSPRGLITAVALGLGVAGSALFIAPTATYARQFVTPCHRPVSPGARRHLLVRVDSCRLGRRSALPLVHAQSAFAAAAHRAPFLPVAAIVALPRTLTPVITALNPRPGETLTATDAHAYVAVRVEASADLRRVELRLDGRVVPTEVLGRDAAEASVLYQPRRWTTGQHCAAIRAWDTAGQVVGRAWRFTIAATPSRAGRAAHHAPVGRPGQVG